ncbi:MAG: glycosyltransferase family 4 protein, partial [Betaproteobacteria bacterium]|nr:glycosyltransferase family 4 protein [Betaproteobacteria bacterium]
LIQKKPQIVHLNTSMEPKSYWRDIAYLCIALIMGKKVVYQVHGGALPQIFFKGNRFLTKLLELVLRSADVVVVLAQRELVAYRDFIPNHHLEIIPNAIEVGADAQWKKESVRQNKPLRLVYVGRLAKSKGVFEIIEALRILCNRDKNIQLIIAGSGPEEARLHACVEDLRLDNYIHFVGTVFGEEKKRVWEQADLFIFPTYHEGLPYTLLESMATRTPPVVSPVGAIPDVIQDGIHGVFVTPGNPDELATVIERLDNDRALICRMGEASRQRVESYYTINRLAGDFSLIYHGLVNLK